MICVNGSTLHFSLFAVDPNRSSIKWRLETTPMAGVRLPDRRGSTTRSTEPDHRSPKGKLPDSDDSGLATPSAVPDHASPVGKSPDSDLSGLATLSTESDHRSPTGRIPDPDHPIPTARLAAADQQSPTDAQSLIKRRGRSHGPDTIYR